MSTLLDRAGREVLVADGAMGSLLIASGADPASHLDHLNITAPDMVEGIHRQYVQAGADMLVTNSFQASRPRLEEHHIGDQLSAINAAGVRLARKAKPAYVAASVGPTGLLIEPLGTATFDDAYAVFREQIEALTEAKPDVILVETFGDVQEARAAVLAARECCDIPVAVTCTFGADGRTNLSGTTPEIAALVLSRLGADLVGANCGLGPVELFDIVRDMPRFSSVPVICQPNAGVPQLVDGNTVYPGSPDVSAEYAARMVEAGIAIVGSCCGSTPAFTAAISAAIGHSALVTVERARGLMLASRSVLVTVDGASPTTLIGERLNPSGRASLAEALRAGDLGAYRELAVAQARAHADLLDVNVGLPGIDEPEMLLAATRTVADAVATPLVIDSSDPAALETALRCYPGRALVNSINGGEDSLDRVLPIVAKYGACAVIMPLDEAGIPSDAAGRLEVAARVLARAADLGLAPDDFLLDGIVMAAAAGPDTARATLETVSRARAELGVGTVLGISNVSHGLPSRPILNRAFLAMAQKAGVDAVMADAIDPETRVVLAAGDLLAGRDPHGSHYVERAAGVAPKRGGAAESATPAERLAQVVEDGDVESAVEVAEEALAAGLEPLDAISGVLTPAIQRVGEAFGRGEAFLPQVLQAAEAMKRAVARLKAELPADAAAHRGTIVLATVQGDIHSIGKDIVATLLESNGFRVVDLGVDVAPGRVVEAVKTEGAVAVGLSALMTTTLPAMAETVKLITALYGIPVLAGGAVLTPDWATSIGAVYAPDAIAAVATAGELLGK